MAATGATGSYRNGGDSTMIPECFRVRRHQSTTWTVETARAVPAASRNPHRRSDSEGRSRRQLTDSENTAPQRISPSRRERPPRCRWWNYSAIRHPAWLDPAGLAVPHRLLVVDLAAADHSRQLTHRYYLAVAARRFQRTPDDRRRLPQAGRRGGRLHRARPRRGMDRVGQPRGALASSADPAGERPTPGPRPQVQGPVAADQGRRIGGR